MPKFKNPQTRIQLSPGTDPKNNIWRIYKTRASRQQAIDQFLKNGFKYIIGWLDTQGYGLQVVRKAQWQNDDSPAHINLR